MRKRRAKEQGRAGLAWVAVLLSLSVAGCSGHARGFLEPEESEEPEEPESLECPSDCVMTPCPYVVVLRFSDVFPNPGVLEVFGEQDGWVYLTAESGRTLLRVQECVRGPDVEVLARTESAFSDVVVTEQALVVSASAGRILALPLGDWTPSLLHQFDTTLPVPLEPATSSTFLATTATLEGLVKFGEDGKRSSVADLRYALSPRAVELNDAIIAQRTNPTGRTEIVRLSLSEEEEFVLQEGTAGELELLDARDKGVLFSTRLDETNRLISFIPSGGGRTTPLIEGPLVGSVRWTDAGILYAARETTETGTEVVQVREASTGLGNGIVPTSIGRPIYVRPSSLFTSGRKAFLTTGNGLLFRKSYQPRGR